MSSPGNSLNITQAGLVKFDGTNAFTGVTVTQYDVLVGAASNGITSVGPGQAGQVLQSGGASASPAYSTPTYPSVGGTNRQLLMSNGTNNVYTTETWATPGTSGNLLTSNGTNWLSSTPTSVNTLSDDVSTSITQASNNIQLVGHINEQGSTKFSTVVAGTNLANINPMSSARWIVDPLGFNGTHTTIASALTSATSGDTIFLLPGTYTENITLKAGVNITANICDAQNPNVIINGKCTFTSAGKVCISGVKLKTNSDYFLTVTGSAASNVEIFNCFLEATNNTGINNASSGGGTISLSYCQGTALSNNKFFQNSGSNLVIEFSDIEGSSTTDSTVSAGTVEILYSYLTFGITTSSTGILVCVYTQFTAGITHGSTTAGTTLFKCLLGTISGGTASVTVAASCTLTLYDCNLNASGSNAVTGSGTISFNNLSFVNANTMSATTQTPGYRDITRSAMQPAFMAYKSSASTSVTGDGTTYTVICNTAVFDQGSNYNTSTGVFTAPFAGRYFLGATVQLTSVSASMTAIVADIATTGRNMQIGDINGTARDSNNNISFSSGVFVNMAASDTASLTVQASGGAKAAGVNGAASNSTTTFYGYLVC